MGFEKNKSHRSHYKRNVDSMIKRCGLTGFYRKRPYDGWVWQINGNDGEPMFTGDASQVMIWLQGWARRMETERPRDDHKEGRQSPCEKSNGR